MGCCLSTQRRVSSALPSSSGGGAGTTQDRAQADDSSRANIHDPAAASPPLLNEHSTQSFLTASISASDDSPALTPRLSSSSRTDVAHQPPPSVGGGAGAAARRWSRRLSRGAPPSTAASTGAASTATATTATRPNKPLVALDRARRCKGPVLDGGLVASPAPSSPRHAHGRKGGSGVEGPRLTAARLERERDAFWDTRVTGRAEVWGAVRLAAEMVRAGDVASAQGVVDAVGATCPTGEVWRGVFDEWGAEYRVPEWVVVEPAGVVVEGESDEEEEEEEGEGGLAEEKGKGRMGEMVKLRARLSDRGTDVVVQVGMEERVSAVVAKVGEAAKLASTSRIRIAYLGKMLRENESLGAQGYSDGHVVNALVF